MLALRRGLIEACVHEPSLDFDRAVLEAIRDRAPLWPRILAAVRTVLVAGVSAAAIGSVALRLLVLVPSGPITPLPPATVRTNAPGLDIELILDEQELCAGYVRAGRLAAPADSPCRS
jgi:hypothetical protein